MKKIDRIILTIAMTIILFIFFVNIKQSVVILGYIGILAYYLFMFCHVGLGFPLFFLIFVPNEWLDKFSFFIKIKALSVIFEYLFRALFTTPILIFVYIVLPFIFAYMAIGSTDIKVLQQFISIDK